MKIEGVERLAKSMTEDGVGVGVCIFLEKEKDKGKERIVVPLMFNDDESKENAKKTARLLINELGVDNYFFASEGWMASDMFIRPSECKDRKEVIMVHEYKRDLKNRYIMNVFRRFESGKIEWQERREDDWRSKELHSEWNFYLEADNGENISRARAEVIMESMKKRLGGMKEIKKQIGCLGKDGDVEVTEEMLLKVLTNMLMKGMIVPRKEGDKNGM